jgi:hypothetical protein
MVYDPILFLNIRKGDAVDGAPVGGLSPSFGVEDRFIQDYCGLAAEIADFQNPGSDPIQVVGTVIGFDGSHQASIAAAPRRCKG